MFAAETKTFLPKAVGTLSIELRWAIPSGFYGKLFPRSGILMAHFVTIDAGVIDTDFRSIIQVLMLNHHPQLQKVNLSMLIIQKKIWKRFLRKQRKICK